MRPHRPEGRPAPPPLGCFRGRGPGWQASGCTRHTLCMSACGGVPKLRLLVPTVLYGLSDETQPGVGDRLLCCFFSVLFHAVPLPGTAFHAAWLDASSSRGSLRLPRPARFDCPESVLRESVGPELLSGLRCPPGHLCSDQSPGPGPGGVWLCVRLCPRQAVGLRPAP